MLILSSSADAAANDVRRLCYNGANDSALSKVPGRYTCACGVDRKVNTLISLKIWVLFME